MSDVLPPLVLAIRANAGQVKTALAGVGNDVAALDKKTEGGLSKSSKAFNGLAGVGKAALFGIAGAGLAVGAMSLKLGVGFQEATTQLVTGAGESEQNIGMIRKGLLDMAPAVGMGPEALAKAMFLVESAGYHGADGLKVMKAAAEGAKIGGADATVVANGLTTAMTDYHIPASQDQHAGPVRVSLRSPARRRIRARRSGSDPRRDGHHDRPGHLRPASRAEPRGDDPVPVQPLGGRLA
jgi:hypothetical protein